VLKRHAEAQIQNRAIKLMKDSPLLKLFGAVVVPLVACASLVTLPSGAKPQGQASAATPPATQSTQSKPQTGAQVTLNNFKFEPPNLTVTAGTTVTWTNKENSPHTVTADDNSFSSPNLAANAAFSQTFTKPGKYAYHCAYHGGKGSGMAGTVTVVVAKGGRKK
jgi:plastocyanin